MKTVIHVNQHIIKSNTKTGAREPVLTVKDYKMNRKGNTVIILDKQGVEVCRVVYSPDKPLPCGARVWIETENKVAVSPNIQERRFLGTCNGVFGRVWDFSDSKWIEERRSKV